MNDLLVGCSAFGILHTDKDPLLSLEDQFRMAAESEIFDYVEKTPPVDEIEEYKRCSEKFNLPVRCGIWFYTVGKEEELFLQNLKIGADMGSVLHTAQVRSYHEDGHLLSNEEIAEFYLKGFDYGEKIGCLPTLEIHVNMWSEDFLRVQEVAEIIQKKGYPFRLTLDHSHIIFKIDNPIEQKIFDIDKDIENGSLVLDPFLEKNICDQWINSNFIYHMHARSTVPNNPKNINAKHPDGSIGRGIQYPFIQPKAGEYHENWDEKLLEHWKLVVTSLINYHYSNQQSPLRQITTEFITPTDYGGGFKYSVFENNVACAKWIKKSIKEIKLNLHNT